MADEVPVHPILAMTERGQRHLPKFIGLDEPSARDLAGQLGFGCTFYDADNPGGQDLSFSASRLRLFLRDGRVAFGSVG